MVFPWDKNEHLLLRLIIQWDQSQKLQPCQAWVGMRSVRVAVFSIHSAPHSAMSWEIKWRLQLPHQSQGQGGQKPLRFEMRVRNLGIAQATQSDKQIAFSALRGRRLGLLVFRVAFLLGSFLRYSLPLWWNEGFQTGKGSNTLWAWSQPFSSWHACRVLHAHRRLCVPGRERGPLLESQRTQFINAELLCTRRKDKSTTPCYRRRYLN